MQHAIHSIKIKHQHSVINAEHLIHYNAQNPTIFQALASNLSNYGV
jgi:hypothetical protein